MEIEHRWVNSASLGLLELYRHSDVALAPVHGPKGLENGRESLAMSTNHLQELNGGNPLQTFQWAFLCEEQFTRNQNISLKTLHN